MVTLADRLCNKDLESTVTSEPYFSERWALLSLALSQHVNNGRENDGFRLSVGIVLSLGLRAPVCILLVENNKIDFIKMYPFCNYSKCLLIFIA